MKRKFLIVAGLFISGLNPLWATSSQKITSNLGDHVHEHVYVGDDFQDVENVEDVLNGE